MSYHFKESTLLHSIGFNFFKIESILNYGILSEKEAIVKEEIPYSRNFFGYNSADMISMIAAYKINPSDLDGAYNIYFKNGISFIVENVPFIYNRKEIVFHRPDEVYVKDKIPLQNITGIIIPEELVDNEFEDINILPTNSTSYLNIKHSCDNIIDYLKKYGYDYESEEYVDYLNELHMINKLAATDNSEDLRNDFKDTIEDLNAFMGYSFGECFKKYLKNDKIKPINVVQFLAQKYNIPLIIDSFDKTFSNQQERI